MNIKLNHIIDKMNLRKAAILTLVCTLILAISACGAPPKRPAFTDPDTVGAIPPKAFIGTWTYTVLNPAVPEENDNETIYRFNPDGTFVGNSKSSVITMQMESTGTWTIVDDKFVIKMESIEETSGDKLAGLAVALVKGTLKKQTGDMNPYSITPKRIVMYSTEHGTAIQLDRI